MVKLRFSLQMWLAIGAGAYLIPGLLGYFFVLNPLFTNVADAQREREATDEYLMLKSTATQLNQFKERVSNRNSERRFQASFDSLVAATGVEIVSVRPDTSVIPWKGGFAFRTYHMSIDGFYPQLNKFIDGVEQPHEYYIITDLSLERIDSRTGRAQAQLQVLALSIPGP